MFEPTDQRDLLANRYCTNSPHAITDTVDGEAIAIRLDTGAYYSFSPGGTTCWNLLRQGVRPFDLGPALGGDTTQIANFVHSLQRDGLLRVNERDVTPPELDPTLDLRDVAISYEHHLEMADVFGLDPIHDVDPESGWPVSDMQPHKDAGIA